MNLIILTNGYPNKNKDTFVNNEIEALSRQFDNIFIIPTLLNKVILLNGYKTISDYKLPSNVYVIDINYSLFDLFCFNYDTIVEFINEFQFNLKFLFMQFRYLLNSNIVKKNILRLMRDFQLQEQDTILYSFWFHYNALAISQLSKYYFLKVSRTHGYDLYLNRGHQPFKSFILSKIDYILPCSKMGRDYLEAQYNIGEKNIPLYLGSKNMYQVTIKKRNLDCFTIVSCSTIVNVKRVWKIVDLLEAIRIDIKINWIHIGDGPAYDEVWNYASERLSSRNNISFNFLGRLSNDEIMTYYFNNQINAFINVSESEGLPISIMEACSFGIPIIATDVGGVSEIVRNGINGFLIRKDFTINELVDVLVKMIELNNYEFELLMMNSRKIWEDKFDATKNYKNFADQLLKGKIINEDIT